MVELEPIELIFEAAHCIAKRLHLRVAAAGHFHDLVNKELRISSYIEELDAKFDGDAEAAEDGLILRHVFGCREVKTYHVAHMYSEG